MVDMAKAMGTAHSSLVTLYQIVNPLATHGTLFASTTENGSSLTVAGELETSTARPKPTRRTSKRIGSLWTITILGLSTSPRTIITSSELTVGRVSLGKST